MSLLGRRRVIQDYLAGALWVLPTLAVVVFLPAGAALSSVEVDEGSPLAKLAFQGTADDARSLLMAVSSTMITVTGLVFALTIVALQIASGQVIAEVYPRQPRDREPEGCAPPRRRRRSACRRPAPAMSRPSTPSRWSGRPWTTT